MANLDLFIDIAALRAVQSFSDSNPVTFPSFVAWDTINARIRLMERTVSFPVNPYSFIPTTGLTLQLAIGIDQGSPLSTQYSWTPSGSLSDPYFEAVIPLNTSGITTATSDGPVDAKLHIRKVGADGNKTVLLAPIRLVPGIITDTSLEVAAPLTPLSLETANAIYLQRIIKGPVTWVCETDDTKRRDTFVDADGNFREDPS